MTDPSFEIVNVVGAGNTRREIDLQELYNEIQNNVNSHDAEYNHEAYAGIIVRLDGGEGPTTMIYGSGKYIIAGATSVKNLNNSNEVILNVFDEIGLETKGNRKIELKYIVSTYDFETELDLPLISMELGSEKTEFEPEQFPTVIYRPDGINVVYLINNSGKVVITGAKSKDDIKNGINHLQKKLDYLLE